MNDYIMHIGTPHEGPIPHSGRFPYGSGDHAFQRHMDFYTRFNREKLKGTSKKDMAVMFGFIDKFGNPDVKRLEAEYSLSTRSIMAHQTLLINKMHDEDKIKMRS